ncbi:hypothetical protein FGO68_gene3850 [Halteria grandinella]|uniref:Uncharacterized protein n=1 Tax=Halteria grandinella TaxID=5974 RepID=A0A8J8NM83_HALGN|nr:hypothetical protein FGO68_gene3850 [Halteria grandinella]
MRNAQSEVGEIVTPCNYLIFVNKEEWVDYLFYESAARGAYITKDNHEKKIIVYKIRRTDLPGQSDEYAVITTKDAIIDGKVRWIEVDKPLAHGSVYFVENQKDYNKIPAQQDQEVQISALTVGNFDKNSIVTLENKNRNASLFNKQTYKGLNQLFIKLCKLLTTKNDQLIAKKNNKY